MVLFNHATREMTAKIVYYGPGLCGKTTNLMVIFEKLDPKSKGKMLSLATKTDRTLFFDLLPVDIGKVGNFNLKIQLYTVPGQVFYNETRKLVLKGADAVVFVADSQQSMVESDRESFGNLLENLEQNQIDPNDTPIVIQYNKRDIPGVLPVEELQEQLGFEGYPYTEASAVKGEGVMETFRLVSKITAKHLFNRLKGKSEPPPKRVAVREPARVAADPESILAPAPEPEAPPVAAEAPVAVEAEPETIEAPVVNPFSDAVPFPESEAVDPEYEKAEEVSLDELLEGRERPATFSGNVPLPGLTDEASLHAEGSLEHAEEVEDIEELGAEELVPVAEEVPPAVSEIVAEPEAIDALDAVSPIVEEPLAEVAFEPTFEAGTSVSEPEATPEAVHDPRVTELEGEIRQLQQQLGDLRQEHQAALSVLLRDLTELTERVRQQIG